MGATGLDEVRSAFARQGPAGSMRAIGRCALPELLMSRQCPEVVGQMPCPVWFSIGVEGQAVGEDWARSAGR